MGKRHRIRRCLWMIQCVASGILCSLRSGTYSSSPAINTGGRAASSMPQTTRVGMLMVGIFKGSSTAAAAGSSGRCVRRGEDR